MSVTMSVPDDDPTCRQLAGWDHLLGTASPPRVNVDVPSLQLDDNLPGHVAAALELRGVDSSRSSVQVTESARIKDPTTARDVLRQLRDWGIELAIDDFGPGCFSLAYLWHLPADCLKVDRSFGAALANGHSEIASAVIALAATLNLRTVATHLQGFSLAVPMTGGHAAAWLAAHGEDSL